MKDKGIIKIVHNNLQTTYNDLSQRVCPIKNYWIKFNKIRKYEVSLTNYNIYSSLSQAYVVKYIL